MLVKRLVTRASWLQTGKLWARGRAKGWVMLYTCRSCLKPAGSQSSKSALATGDNPNCTSESAQSQTHSQRPAVHKTFFGLVCV